MLFLAIWHGLIHLASLSGLNLCAGKYETLYGHSYEK